MNSYVGTKADAVVYMEKQHEKRDLALEAILKNPSSTREQIREATKAYVETAWLLEYFRSSS